MPPLSVAIKRSLEQTRRTYWSRNAMLAAGACEGWSVISTIADSLHRLLQPRTNGLLPEAGVTTKKNAISHLWRAAVFGLFGVIRNTSTTANEQSSIFDENDSDS